LADLNAAKSVLDTLNLGINGSLKLTSTGGRRSVQQKRKQRVEKRLCVVCDPKLQSEKKARKSFDSSSE